jgi:hypothetical protein
VSFSVNWNYHWDAEIILRSFYEKSAKLLYVMLSENGEKQQLIDEFWGDLGSVYDRKTAQRAVYAEKLFDPGLNRPGFAGGRFV